MKIDFENLKNKKLSNVVAQLGDTVLNSQFIDSKFKKNKYVILPSFCDAHTHLREPGFFYKETIKTGTQSASRGGYTLVFSMPNLNPTPDCLENLNKQLDIIKKDAVIDVIPYGTITKGQNGEELANFEELSSYVCGFSDDGKGVQNEDVLFKAMVTAKSLDKLIVCHCEDNSLLNGGYIHLGEYAKKHNHKGISSQSEYKQIERDLELVKKTGVKYHVCHISTKESVELIRKAKLEGLDVTCETAPHYLVLTDKDLKEDGNYKMNPPVRSEEDRLALIEGIKDGTIDMIATDHAPHSKEEKSKGLEKSLFGIVGLETCFPLMYTHLVKTKIITMEELVKLMCVNPRKRFGIKSNNKDFTIFEISKKYKIKSEEFLSKGKNTPFENYKVYGKCLLTVKDGKIIYQK